MDYTQHNPCPLPDGEEFREIRATIDTVFDWKYELEKKNLLGLYEKGKDLAWNANDLDWTIDVDIERMMQERLDNGMAAIVNEMMKPPKNMGDEAVMRTQLNMNAFMLSQFLHGEQGALIATAKIVQGVPWEEAKFYAANQVADEARHVAVYHRYLTEKLGVSYEIVPSLKLLLDDIVKDSRWDITFLGMQIMVEGLALAAFGTIRQSTHEPLLRDVPKMVITDEARHVHYGVCALDQFYARELPERERREREDWAYEMAVLMRNRFLAHEFYEEHYAHVMSRAEWNRLLLSSEIMGRFRRSMFRRIVPNLKRIGLLSDRIRAHYAELGLLDFEHEKAAPDLTAEDLLAA